MKFEVLTEKKLQKIAGGATKRVALKDGNVYSHFLVFVNNG